MRKIFLKSAFILLFLAACFMPVAAIACPGHDTGPNSCAFVVNVGAVRCRIHIGMFGLLDVSGAPLVPTGGGMSLTTFPIGFPINFPNLSFTVPPQIAFNPLFSGCPGCNANLNGGGWAGWPVWPGQTIDRNVHGAGVFGNSSFAGLVSGTRGSYPVIPHAFASSNNTVIVGEGLAVGGSGVFGGRILESVSAPMSPNEHNNPGQGDFTALPMPPLALQLPGFDDPSSSNFVPQNQRFFTALPLLASYNTAIFHGRTSSVVRGGDIMLRNNLLGSRFMTRGNTVTIQGSAANTAEVAGGVAGGSVFANANDVYSYSMMNRVTIGSYSNVGRTHAGAAAASTLTFTGYLVQDITGGDAGGARTTATGNRVYIKEEAIVNNELTVVTTDVTVTRDISGGRAMNLEIFPGALTFITPNNATATATDNHVTISGASNIRVGILGGTATSNTNLTINSNQSSVVSGDNAANPDSVRGSISGGLARVRVTGHGTLEAANNSVTVRGDVTVLGNIYGGRTDLRGDTPAMPPAGPTLSEATAAGNSVDISGSEVAGNIFGGFVTAHAPANMSTLNAFTGSATNNTVTISGGASTNLNDSTLFGGFVGLGSASAAAINRPYAGMDAVSGNTLNVNSALITVNGVENFYNMNFRLPTDIMSATYDGIMLTSNNPANVFSVGNGSNTVGISFYPAIPLSLPNSEDYGFDVTDPDTLPTDIILILNVTDVTNPASPFAPRHVIVGQYKFCVFVANHVDPAFGIHNHNLVARLIGIDLGGGGNNGGNNDSDPCDCDYGAAGGPGYVFPRTCISGGGNGCNAAGAGFGMLALLLALVVKKIK